MKRVCKDCTHTFIFTAAEQAHFAAKGFPPKQRCADCIQAKKAKQSGIVAAVDVPALPKYDEKTEAKLDAWLAAKRAKDFQTADRLRWELRGDNIDPDAARPVGYFAATLHKNKTVMSSGDSSQGAKKKPDGAPGHSSKCFNCGKIGHASSECKVRPSGSTACYFCGKEGHQSKDCPDAPAKVAFDPAGARCYGCGKIGHLSRDCPDPSRAQACYTCGEKGHNTRCQPRHASKRDFRVPGDRQIPPKRSPLLMAQSHFCLALTDIAPRCRPTQRRRRRSPSLWAYAICGRAQGLANVVRTATLLTLEVDPRAPRRMSLKLRAECVQLQSEVPGSDLVHDDA